MICFSIKTEEFVYSKFMVESRTGCAVEMRLDDTQLDTDDIKELFARPHRPTLVASYLSTGHADLTEAVELLSVAILSGADIVDIGLWLPKERRQWLMNLALNKGCKVILSYHNFHETPDSETLEKIVNDSLIEGADIVKIATTATYGQDTARITKLYDKFPAEKLIAFAMGAKGKESRLESYYRGAPLFYMATCRKEKTAAGQYCHFDFVKPEKILLRGTAEMPASKSCTQRAILLAALTEGRTKLYNWSECNDNRSAVNVAKQFGAEIIIEGSTITIEGHQNLRERGLVLKNDVLNVGESGLLARLCIPLCALADRPVILTGEASLARRKICQQKTLLKKFGINILRAHDTYYLPLLIGGHLHGSEGTINGSIGSQLISGLLLALTQCDRSSILNIKNITSEPYLNLTTQIGTFFGLQNPDYPEDRAESTRTYFIDGRQKISPLGGMELERDWSAAAYFIAAGAIMGDVTIPGMNFYSEQADRAIFDFMEDCHVDIVKLANGDINVRRSIICPFSFDINETPDLIGPLMLLALRADGESCICGLERLRNKESDRAQSFLEEFHRIGADLFIAEDGNLYIEGEPDLRLRGGHCSSHGDHRLAMALLIAGLFSDRPVIIDDLRCISKSFPGFLATLEKLKTI